MKTWLSGRWAFSVAAVVVLGGCEAPEGGDAGGGGGGGFQFPPTAVEVAPVEVGPVANSFQTLGTLVAGEDVTIVSEIDAIVRDLPFREGDPIQQGAAIARLDDAELAADLARAKALRDQRKAAYQRVLSIVEQGAGAQQDLDDATATLRVAAADVALARARLKKTRIVAPFTGVVGTREVSPGAFLRAGQPITVLVQLDELEVAFSVPERYAGQLSRGVEVAVSTIAYPGYQLTGSVDVVDPSLDPITRSVRVIARIPNPDLRFRPGMSANVTVILSARESAMTIPGEAVFADGAQFFAYVIQPDSTVARAALRLGTRFEKSVEILEGLKADDRVVRAGHQKLFPGAKVFAVNSGAEAATGAETNGAAAEASAVAETNDAPAEAPAVADSVPAEPQAVAESTP